MKQPRWSRLPRWWVRKHLRSSFKGGVAAGQNVAALRVYLAVVLLADGARRVSVTWSRLEEVTGLSRPMVAKGIGRAATLGILAVDKSSHRHVYHLVGEGIIGEDDVIPFAQIPQARLLEQLREMPARGQLALDALKMYITLAVIKERNGWVARIGHMRITEWTGMQPRNVRRAIDVLVNHRLVHVTMAESNEAGHPHNEYTLLGFEHGEAAQARTGSTIVELMAELDDPVPSQESGILVPDTATVGSEEDVPF